MSVLTYTLVVNGPLYGTQSARSAYQFARALLQKGHTLVSVFFYQDGVTNGTSLSVPANDEFDLAKAWQNLAKEHGVSLETCVAASLRRGILSEKEAAQHCVFKDNLADEFVQAGLGSLAEAMLTQDRVIQF
ncbi:sulfurtransferase complex subunit TusD [Vibrio gazogenes]|uniref:Sulfurtransferase TusD homolog n=1 Tax=Vibrio gazogenes DSM 21264 = NBRC 103151 TaxID=1123492 RepID=A0A1M5H443_VIBGA|nr:sulfurtransferase complex subunit TusD [Vibrio gazogenes]USP13482.1 sulfurtransferase complex subunit TusD [Vibrio gazogenes]SHG10811.1 tRNA 2-thiouridine synthesizing protein D [Vibrio gazogenes DSM 21264] [Vibrio gazogenes DSM 21264 = NBRC 103151]SJN57347.1 Sulfurtransferase TusD [Vibrio gazogenes]